MGYASDTCIGVSVEYQSIGEVRYADTASFEVSVLRSRGADGLGVETLLGADDVLPPLTVIAEGDGEVEVRESWIWIWIMIWPTLFLVGVLNRYISIIGGRAT
jgi:hypothetical protein